MKGDKQRSISIKEYWDSPRSKKHRKKNSTFAKFLGKTNKGIKRSDKFCKHLSKTRKGDKNPNWVGTDITYKGLHTWIRRNKLRPELCECCKEVPPYDLANISGEYRRDIKDFEWLCRRCHMNKDGRNVLVLNNLKQFKKDD